MKYRLSNIRRALHIDLEGHNAAFLWGPRKTGKTTLLHQQFSQAKFYDLLNTALRTKLLLKPSILREEVVAESFSHVVIDEIQKVPALLDEVHWCLENTPSKFILCGSSARKLKRGAANLLGGRAWRFELFPLTTSELSTQDLIHILNHGLLPQHFLAKKPERILKSYVVDYLSEEIQAEALTRNIPAFARFLEAVSLTHGALINYANIARDCGVSPKTVREYYQILEDTLLGHRLSPWRRRKKRRLIETEKFYLFDVGVVRALRGLPLIQSGTEEFGQFFEHFLIEEMRAYLSYREKEFSLSYWRTSTGLEVDLIVGDFLAIEFKATMNIREEHFQGLKAFQEEQHIKHALLVCLVDTPRKREDGIFILPWQTFCEKLWGDEWVS